MSQLGESSSLNHLMRLSTSALYECQDSISQEVDKKANGVDSINADQAEHLLKLMEALVDTKIEMTNEIEAGRVNLIDPEMVAAMEDAIMATIGKPLDEKVNQIYFSIFGYNSALWTVLKEMQKLLRTVGLLKQKGDKKVAKVAKTPSKKRKKPHEKDVLSSYEEEKNAP